MNNAHFAIRDYCIMLVKQGALDPDIVADALTGFPITRAEINLTVRRQRGFLFGKQSEELASEIAEALTRAGIEAMAMPFADVASLRHARRILRMEIMEDGIYLPGVASIGANGFVPAESIRLLSAGLIAGASEIKLSEEERSLIDADASGEVARALIQRAAREAKDANFPLTEYLLQAPEDTVNYQRLQQEHDGRPRAKRTIAQRYRDQDREAEIPRYISAHPNLGGRLLLVTDHGVHMLTAETAVFERREESSFGHWVRAFHPLVLESATALIKTHGSDLLPLPQMLPNGSLVADAFYEGGTCIPPETSIFAMAFDSNAYLFDDEDSFIEHAQWWMLNGGLAG